MFLKMLTRRILPSLFFSLVLLVCIWTGATELESILTVDLEDEEARNKEFSRAPPVCFVKFIQPEGYNITNQQCHSMDENSCTVARNGSNLNALLEKSGSPPITFDITFNFSLDVGCSNYIPNILYNKSAPAREIYCNPIVSCNNLSLNETSVGSVQWRRFANNNFLQNSSNVSEVSNNDKDPIRADGSLFIANFTNTARYDMVGYYVVTIPVNGQDVYAQIFVLYANPDLASSSGAQTVTYGESNTKDFRKIFCQFYSFPPAFIHWSSPDGSNFTTIDTGNELVVGDTIEPTLSINGRLVFEQVQYDDGGEYTCIAVHSISGARASHDSRLRVRNPLRPLWPFLGIVGSLIITFLLMIGGTYWDKALRKLTSAPDDEGAFQRNYSVVSNIGEDSGDTRHTRKHQAAGKRISITQEELLANASDPN